MLGDLSLRDQMSAQQRIDPYRVGKYSAGPLLEGCDAILLLSSLRL